VKSSSRPKALACLLLTSILLGSCSSINIQTGPPSEEQVTEKSTIRGKGVRADYADRLSTASPMEKAYIVKTFIDSTLSSYIDYGLSISDQWRKANESSGKEVSDREIQQMIENSTQSDMPLLEAYDDVVDYGVDQLLRTIFFDESTESMFTDFRDHYYQVSSAVFIPNGNQDDYRYSLLELQTETEEQSLRLAEDLRRYR